MNRKLLSIICSMLSREILHNTRSIFQVFSRCSGPVHTSPFSNENGAVLLRHDRLPDHSTVGIQNGEQTLPRGFNFAGRYIEMRMCRVHLSMWTEGMKAFSKQIRPCSVDGRKRYENDKCGRKSFSKRSKTAPFSFENGLVWTGPEHLENTWKIDRVL